MRKSKNSFSANDQWEEIKGKKSEFNKNWTKTEKKEPIKLLTENTDLGETRKRLEIKDSELD